MTSATSGSCAGSRGPPRAARERPREVHVAEDASGLVTLVRAADEDRVGVLADEIEAVEILDHRRHRQRDHAPAVQQTHRSGGRRLQLVAGDVDAEPPQLATIAEPVRTVMFVTNRSRWPRSRSVVTASAAPAIGLPETWKTPSMSRRMAAMARESTGIGEAIRVTRSVTVPRREIELRFSRSSGPGGQHAQRTETRVEAIFDVVASSALTDRQRKRVIAKAGPVLRAVAQDERSQWQNRELATARVIDALRAALEVPRREADEADEGRAGAAPRRKAAARRAETAEKASRGRT